MGLRSLLISSGYKNIDSTTISFGIAPRINAAGRMGSAERALKLLLSENKAEAAEIAAATVAAEAEVLKIVNCVLSNSL